MRLEPTALATIGAVRRFTLVTLIVLMVLLAFMAVFIALDVSRGPAPAPTPTEEGER